MYLSRKLMTDSADVLDVIRAEGNFENLSTHTIMYFFVPHINGNGPAKSNSIFWFGYSAVGSFPRLLWFERGFKFLPALTHSIKFSP